MADEKKVIGRCPACGGDVVESPKAYGCSNWKTSDGACKFAIWKNIAQRELSEDEAKALLEYGETEVLDGFVSKKGNNFSAKLVLEDDKVSFKFPERN